MMDWCKNSIKENDILKNNELITNIFSFFLNIDIKNKVYKDFNKFTYDQILCLLIMGRFVIGVIMSVKTL